MQSAPFGEYNDPSGWNGLAVSAYYLNDCCGNDAPEKMSILYKLGHPPNLPECPGFWGLKVLVRRASLDSKKWRLSLIHLASMVMLMDGTDSVCLHTSLLTASMSTSGRRKPLEGSNWHSAQTTPGRWQGPSGMTYVMNKTWILWVIVQSETEKLLEPIF